MIEKKDWILVTLVCILFTTAISLPYYYASNIGGSANSFNGFLLNPQDGNSYLAKMYQGWQGEWRFKLPFTYDPGEGVYIFLFYLGLGHLARIFDLSLILVFHTARILCSLLMLISLWEFFKVILESPRSRRIAFFLATLGSGMGWLLLGFGLITSDFWIAEAYPFLSAYANPHFPLSIAIVVWILKKWFQKDKNIGTYIFTVIGSLALSVINPFGVIVLLIVFAGVGIWQLVSKREYQENLRALTLISLSGIPLLVYDYWIANFDPIIRIWNQQNITPSPPIWDILVSFSPALLFGIYGILCITQINQNKIDPKLMVLLVWAVCGLGFIYLPLGLQRRFMLGIYIPVSGLAAYGIDLISKDNRRMYLISLMILFSLAIPSNLITIMASISGIQEQNALIYLLEDEVAVLKWIENNTELETVILASPEMGLFIPAYTGRRVVYGHPYESLDALENKKIVEDIYSGKYSKTKLNQFLLDYGIDIIMVGPREINIGFMIIPDDWLEVYNHGGISLYYP